MTEGQESRLTQSFLGLSDEAFNAVPILEKALVALINAHLEEHHATMGTVMTALACVAGEFTVMTGNEAEAVKKKFLQILDAYTGAGMIGGRSGPDSERSLIRVPVR
jgi:hypothetical protein